MNLRLKCLIGAMIIASISVSGCKDKTSEPQKEPSPSEEAPLPDKDSSDQSNDFNIKDPRLFEVKSGIPLPQEDQKAFDILIKKIDPKRALDMATTTITDEQYAKVKKFVNSDIINSSMSEEKKFETIFYWVVKNISYRPSPNDANSVFENRCGVCGGYANLLKVMLLSQNIPCIVVDGYYMSIGSQKDAHAWNYAYVNGRWIVADPTNNRKFEIDDEPSFIHLQPKKTDIAFFEDDKCKYGYNFGFCVTAIKSDRRVVSLPYSYDGYILTSFIISEPIPSNLKTLYISDNITTIGENAYSLNQLDTSLENIFISDGNETLNDYKGVVYERGSEIPLYVPKSKTVIYLKPMERVGKNALLALNNLTELHFDKATKVIEDYAIEDCRNLKIAYIPSGTQVSDKAFVNVHQDFR
ncbi:MAG: transglutaminase domain-containing protein, partial [Porphyromonadaceae bacterium]|nr:transglutaminase domain-containing protein [Porphyromonadaceae bacterium]